jgi:hypothetical protein
VLVIPSLVLLVLRNRWNDRNNSGSRTGDLGPIDPRKIRGRMAPGEYRNCATQRRSDLPFYGKHPEGLIVYDRGGWMSVQIVSDPPPTVPTSSSREETIAASPAEKAKALDGYYAYCGTWTLDLANATVTHHIRQSLYPGERGEDAVRHFVLDGDRLILTAKAHEMGEDHERKLVWQRVQKGQP